MQTRKILVTLVVVAGLILAACTSTSTSTNMPTNTSIATPANPSTDTLNNTGWVLVNMNGQAVLPDTPVTINFEDGKLNGTDGCNSYSSTYSVNGDQFSVNQDIASTMMACPEPIMQQAAAYIAALTQAAAYKIDGQQLTLSDASGKTLATFTRQSSELGGTSWIVTGYNNGKQAVVSVVIGSELTADFSVDGNLSGSSGCNNYTARYEVSGKSIQVGPTASTRKMCADPAGVMEQETQFLQALETAATYRLDGSQLELRTADGALAVTLARAGTTDTSPTQAPQTAPSISQALPNAEYPVDLTSTGKAQLKDGIFEEPAAPGSATKIKVQLGSQQAFGDVNGDGAQDAAVTLVVDPGGSGTFTYLALVINDQGTAKPIASVLLGDRISVKSLALQPGSVVVTMLTRSPDEPMSAEPTLEVTRTFMLQGDMLVEVK
jgi:heat shock protein HslJ